MSATTVADRPSPAPGGFPDPLVGLLLANFLVLGLTFGVQGVLWADVVTDLGLSKGAFGTAQLVAPLVAIGLLLQGGPLSAKVGTQRLAIASLVLMAGAALALAGSTNLWSLVGALGLLGAGLGLFETAMNGAGLDWERRTGRAVLNTLHAGFSAGAVAGALGTGVLLGQGWRSGGVFLLLASITFGAAVATLLVSFPHPPATSAGPSRTASTASTGGAPISGPGIGLAGLFRRGPLLTLAVICMLGSIGESVANLWSVIYLRELGAGAVAGGATFAFANGTMFAGRVVNAPLVARFGPRASLLTSGSGLILATILLLLPGGLAPAVAGFGILGLAIAGVVPTVLSAGARLAPGQSAAVAAGLMAAVYVSFTVAPPLVGWLAERFSLQTALLVVGISGLGILGLVLTFRTSSPPDRRRTAAPPVAVVR